MTNAAFAPTTSDPVALLFPDLETELRVTRSLLAIVPFDQRDWKPHAKSASLWGLACHVVQLLDLASAIATTDSIVFDPSAFATPALNSTEELVARFDTKADNLRHAFSQLDWPRLNGTWKMMLGEQALLDGQRSTMLRHMGINHIVHHRAQLGVYLRLLDVKLPGSYGPSADT